MSDKLNIHRKVADLLGMEIEEFDEPPEPQPVVPVPDKKEIKLVKNEELPELSQELTRIEHGQRQTEYLYERGIAAVQNILADVPLTPPIYKGRVVESAAELFKAVTALGMQKVEYQIKLAELKLKLAAFARKKHTEIIAPAQNITGNTIIVNREEMIKAFRAYDEDEGGD